MEWIVWPGESPGDVALVGGKGAALWQMLQHKFPVPPVCCVSSVAYQHWCQTGRGTALPEPCAQALQAALQRLAGLSEQTPRFAVRSSALAEDSTNASFAGQLSTLLNVSAAQVPEAVITVWRAAEHSSVKAYQASWGEQHGPVAVLIQVMIPAEVAGVVFTADPRRQTHEHLVVNATWGLGEGLVSGAVTPDHWVLDRLSGELLEQRLGEKASIVQALATGGTSTATTPPARQQQWSLLPEQLDALRLLALRIEGFFGIPQDIEWAYAGEQFWLLQARPITTLSTAAMDTELESPTAPETVWTAANIQEVIPGLLSPLGWSLLHEHLNDGLSTTFRAAGAQGKEAINYLALFYHRPFLNATALRQAAARSIGSSPEAVDEQYLGVPRPPSAPPPPLSWSVLRHYCRAMPRALWLTWRTPWRLRRVEARLRPQLRAWRQQERQQLSAAALQASLERVRAHNRTLSALHIATTSGASAFFETLRHWLQHWLGEEASILWPHLTTGLQQIPSAAPGVALAVMAALVCQDPALCEALRAPDAWRTLSGLTGPAATALRASLTDFLGRYGHRGVMEFDVAARTWEDDPASVLALLRPLLAAGDAAQRVGEQALAQRRAATATVMQRLTFWQRPLFRLLLRQAQQYVILRERSKSLLLEMTHALRLLLREVGRRLVAQGVLTAPHELYFLTWQELQPSLSSITPGAALSGLIRRRRHTWLHNHSLRLPETFQGRPQPLAAAAPPDGKEVLRGIPVCPGVVTGPARVILDPRQDTALQPGDILVAPVTDAAWTPLFLVAAGVVVDIGGPLSHGAIVAREYGVPTVVNVKQATRQFRTGERLTLNGTTGEVWATDGEVGS